jgi:hypothetical protein
MALLYGKVAHERIEVIIHLGGRAYLPAFGVLYGTPASQLAGSKDGDGLGRTDTLEAA